MNRRCFLALVHHPTVDREGKIVATAVTTLDLHDLARLARTYELGGVFVATPLEAQRQLVDRLLSHWIDGHGGRVNPCRREALLGLRLVHGLEGAVEELESTFGRRSLLVATSARTGEGRWSFSEARARIAENTGPVLLVLGTGWGLAPELYDRCDGILEPVRGPGPYNHLSVRSAASIMVDRLLGDRDEL